MGQSWGSRQLHLSGDRADAVDREFSGLGPVGRSVAARHSDGPALRTRGPPGGGGLPGLRSVRLHDRPQPRHRRGAHAVVRPLDPSVNGGPNRPKADRFASWRPSENTSAERSPTVLQAIERKKIEFAVDQQEYLQGYLPVVVLA